MKRVKSWRRWLNLYSDAEERADQKKLLRERKEQEKVNLKQKMEEAELRSYASLMSADKMTSNKDDGNDSDDFM